jgi:hypothetical protein
MKNMSYIGKIKSNTSFLSIVVLSLVVSISVMMAADNFFDTTAVAYDNKLDQMRSNITHSIDIQNIPAKKVHVGDIDIAYKTFGKGDAILLISGSSNVMDVWPSSMLQELSSNHTVIIFDNRGVGNTTSGTRQSLFSNLQMILLDC